MASFRGQVLVIEMCLYVESVYFHSLYIGSKCRVSTYSYELIEVASFSHGTIATFQKGEEVAGKESIQLEKEVIGRHVQMQVEWLRHVSCN